MTIHFNGLGESLSGGGGVITLPVAHRRSGVYRNFGKRVLESALVVVTAPITLALIALLALAISLDGRNPFFRQRRLGRNGVVFSMWKLRTMVWDAEGRLPEHLEQDPQARAEWDATQKLKRDPRVTPIGRLLRKTSMDELPQLWNVLTGEMSLVGPRPMMVSQRPIYPGTAYFSMRPGITGLWQVSDRNECEFADRAKFDSEYERLVSLAMDVSIVARTLRVVFRATGY